MRFKAGVLGVCVIIIAISATLLGSWVMSMDVNESEVTKYNALTEITGLFESEQTPTFTEYSPSTNYTGYYTEASIVGNEKYWDGVDYTQASSPNNYRLNLQPLSSDSGTLTLSSADDEEVVDSLKYWRVNNYPMYNARCSCTVNQLITNQTWDLDELYIVCQTGSWTYGGFTTIVLADDGDVLLKDPTLTGTLYETLATREYTYAAAEVPDPIMACKYVKWSNEVILYSDTAMTKIVGTSTGDKAILMWSDGGYFFGDQFSYTAYDLPEPEYLDPSKGVCLE